MSVVNAWALGKSNWRTRASSKSWSNCGTSSTSSFECCIVTPVKASLSPRLTTPLTRHAPVVNKLSRQCRGLHCYSFCLHSIKYTQSLSLSGTPYAIVNRLSARDPHQLFQRLESVGREHVIDMKVRLLKQHAMGHKTPTQARLFIATLLDEYYSLLDAAAAFSKLIAQQLVSDNPSRACVDAPFDRSHACTIGHVFVCRRANILGASRSRGSDTLNISSKVSSIQTPSFATLCLCSSHSCGQSRVIAHIIRHGEPEVT